MDCIVHGVAKSWTALSDSLHFTESSYSSAVTSHTRQLSPALRAGLFCRSSFLWHAVMWDGLMLSKQLSKKMSDGGSSTHNLILNLNYKNFNFFWLYIVYVYHTTYFGICKISKSRKRKQVNPQGNQPIIFIGRTDAEAEVLILWPPDANSRLIGKDADAGKDWRQKEKRVAEDETDASPTWWMWISTLWKIVKDRGTWHAAVHGVTRSWTRLSNWTTKEEERNIFTNFAVFFRNNHM